MDKERKEAIIREFRLKEGDTGSTEVQVALLTERINRLGEHLKIHTHDYHSQLGLLKLISQRRRLLRYLGKRDPARYKALIAKLGLRK